MINIISNNCIGSRLYQLNNIQFNTPFVWSAIDIDDFIKLIKNYKKIENEYNLFFNKDLKY